MAWLRLDDRVRTHPKIVQAGPAAAWFWFCGICYCREHLTDGFIPIGMLPSLAPGVTNVKSLAVRLVTAGLWHVVETGYQVHDFLDWNPSRVEVQAAREVDKERKRKNFRPENSRIDDGFPTTPSRDRAGARGSGLGLGSDLGSSEESPRETKPAPLIVSPLEWHRIHGKHEPGFCDWVCLPTFIALEFAGKSGDPGNADSIRPWALTVRAQWEARTIGDDSLVFWRKRWAEAHPDERQEPSKADLTRAAFARAAERRGL